MQKKMLLIAMMLLVMYGCTTNNTSPRSSSSSGKTQSTVVKHMEFGFTTTLPNLNAHCYVSQYQSQPPLLVREVVCVKPIYECASSSAFGTMNISELKHTIFLFNGTADAMQHQCRQHLNMLYGGNVVFYTSPQACSQSVPTCSKWYEKALCGKLVYQYSSSSQDIGRELKKLLESQTAQQRCTSLSNIEQDIANIKANPIFTSSELGLCDSFGFPQKLLDQLTTSAGLNPDSIEIKNYEIDRYYILSAPRPVTVSISISSDGKPEKMSGDVKYDAVKQQLISFLNIQPKRKYVIFYSTMEKNPLVKITSSLNVTAKYRR